MAVADACTMAGGGGWGTAGVSGASCSDAGGHRRPAHFPGTCSRSRPSWPVIRSGCGRNTSCAQVLPLAGPGVVEKMVVAGLGIGWPLPAEG
jgi:hypothetical protein